MVEVDAAGTVELEGLVVAVVGGEMVAATGGELVVLVAVGTDLPAALRSLMISTILSMACRETLTVSSGLNCILIDISHTLYKKSRAINTEGVRPPKLVAE